MSLEDPQEGLALQYAFEELTVLAAIWRERQVLRQWPMRRRLGTIPGLR